MIRIQKLPHKVINLIAAGEVVDRPTNIVKELIENAIDAKSTKITIQISNGGLDMVKVTDNGHGMNEENIVKAFELHFTSKLADEKISNVDTLGFRGEALAAIASVSRISCKSKTSDQSMGHQVILEGGEILKNQPSEAQKGTMIMVSSLFFNTPARRKFLKKPSTERKRITDLIMNFCLLYPDIHFLLEEIQDQRNIKIRIQSPVRKNINEVMYDILGVEIAESMLPLQGNVGNWEITGYISKPILSRSDRSFQFIAINGRVVKHIELQKSIEVAYGSQLLRSHYPIMVLSVTGPTSDIDFNIHPQKAEIRFRASDKIFVGLSNMVKDALSSEGNLPIIDHGKIERLSQTSQIPIDQTVHPRSENTELEDDLSAVQEKGESLPEKQPWLEADEFIQTSLVEGSQEILEDGFRIMGQIMLKFGLLVYRNELWLVDIHAADERVKFEQFERSSHRQAFVQKLLTPISIDLLHSECQLLLDNSNVLAKYGLTISSGTDDQILIFTSPVYFDQQVSFDSIHNLLLDLIMYLGEESHSATEDDSPLSVLEYGLVARLACHGSIRSGKPVSNKQIHTVVKELLKCRNPWTCAHGRPTLLRIPKSRLEGWFKR